MLQGGGPVVSVDHMARGAMSLGNPLSKLPGIGNGGRQEHKACCLRGHNDALLPNHTPLLVSEIVDLIIHNQLHLCDKIGRPGAAV